MTISLLIPVYKGSKTLPDALDSIIGQKISPDEVIIGDDTKPDDLEEIEMTKKIIIDFKNKVKFPVIYIKNKQNLGCQKNFQTLINKACKDIILFLAHDDLLSKNAVSITKQLFNKYKDIGFMTRPYFWFEKQFDKPIRYVPPPTKNNLIIPSINNLIKQDNLGQINQMVRAVFGSIGQISGLAVRRKFISEIFHSDIFTGHMYPIVDIWKKQSGIFIKDYIVAIGTLSSQSRMLPGIYKDSPTQQWIKLFKYFFNKPSHKTIYSVCLNLITTNFTGLIQIKNYGLFNDVVKEILLLVKLRTINLVNLKFWTYIFIVLIIPKQILRYLTDFYKRHINSKLIPKIFFDKKMAKNIDLSKHKIVHDRMSNCYFDMIGQFAKNTKNKKILDIGCGFGNYTSLFLHSKNSVYGLDIEDNRLNQYKSFKFQLYGGLVFPYKSKTFDVVTCFDVLEHIENDVQMVSEIYRVLRPGGKIFIATPNRYRFASIIKMLIRNRDTFPKIMQTAGIGGISIHIREYTAKELYKIFARSKFKNISVSTIWFGLRGKINIGFDQNILPILNHSLFLKASK